MTTAKIWQTETGQAEETGGEETEEISDRPDVDGSFPAAGRRQGILRQLGLRRLMKDHHSSDQAADQVRTHCRPTVGPVFFGTSMGRTGYCHDYMREKLDGRNLIKVTAGRTDRFPTDPVCTKMIHTYIKLLIDASGC